MFIMRNVLRGEYEMMVLWSFAGLDDILVMQFITINAVTQIEFCGSLQRG
jgi:hypothetical protein